MKKERKIIEQILEGTGITINGNQPYDIKVLNEKFYGRVLKFGSLGLGESYMEGWWECEKLDEFFDRILTAKLDKKIKENWSLALKIAIYVLLNPGRRAKAFVIGKRHYDIGNDLYQVMLDKDLTYTCGYWKDANNLEEAQDAKLDLVCRKINLKKGQRVLDIGSGWGSFLGYIAKKYKVNGLGVTVSKEQKALSDKLYAKLNVRTHLQDYRDIKGKFNHIVSFGMFEHVGCKNYRNFMKIAHKALHNDGFFLLHTIGSNESVMKADTWISKYIFPNSMLPSIKQIGKSIEGLFVMEDWHNFGADYDKTLMAWCHNFEKNWDKIKENYDETFYRMWRYYLLACAGAFRARDIQLWQIVLSKSGVRGGYESVR